MNKVNIKEKFFVFVVEESKYKCIIDNCNIRFVGAENSLKRHIIKIHPKVAAQYNITVVRKSDSTAEDNTSVAESSSSPSSLPASKISEPPSKRLKTVTLKVDPSAFSRGLTDMVTKHAMPFNFFNSSSFKDTTGLLAMELGQPNNAEAMKRKIRLMAAKTRELIASELQSRLFSIKFDGAIRHNRKILGVNAQFLQSGKTVIRTLSMNEITCRQTADNIRTAIYDVLADFGVGVGHLYSSTTDRAKNVTSCGKKMRQDQNLEVSQDALNESSSNDFLEHADEQEDNDQHGDDEGEEDADELTDEDRRVEDMLRGLDEIFEQGDDGILEVIGCGAHTLNLVFKDALSSFSDEWLKELRTVVKAAKRAEYRAYFTLAGVPLPKIDVETRWNSTYEMADSVYKHKSFYVDIGEKCSTLKVSDQTWEKTADFIMAFTPLAVAIQRLQSKELVMGDLLVILKKCQFAVSKLSAENIFKQGIEAAIKKREDSLLQNNAFRAAILFDPRWCFLDTKYIDSEGILAAIDHVLKVSKLLKRIKKVEEVAKPEVEPTCDDEFEESLKSECSVTTTFANTEQTDLKRKLIDMANRTTKLHHATNILEYWETLRFDDRELYELAQVVLGAPVTQVSVERCFSAIKLLLENHRLRMSPDLLNDLMILRCNKDLIQTVISQLEQ